MIRDTLVESLRSALLALDVDPVPTVIGLERPARAEHGDWSSNVALVAGKAQLTFRGTVSWKDGELHVAGDRSHAGAFCDEREVAPLSFVDD